MEAVILHSPPSSNHTLAKVLPHLLVTLGAHNPGDQDGVQTLHKVPLVGETVGEVFQVLPCGDDLAKVLGGVVVNMLPVLPVELSKAASRTMDTYEAED